MTRGFFHHKSLYIKSNQNNAKENLITFFKSVFFKDNHKCEKKVLYLDQISYTEIFTD